MKQHLCVHGLNIRVETEFEYLLQLLKRDYGIFFVEQKVDVADIIIRVVKGDGDKKRGIITPMDNLCIISEESMFFFIKTMSDESFYKRDFRKYFTAFISWNLFLARNALCFHSSCVSKNNIGIIFMGESGCGKTSLAVEMGVNGYDYMSNELTFISSEIDNVYIYGMPQEINLGAEALDWFEKNYPERFCLLENEGMLKLEFTEKNKRIYSQRIFEKVSTSCYEGIIIFPEPDLYAEVPFFEKVPPENLAIQLMRYFLFPSEWKFRPYIDEDLLEKLENIFIDIANKIPAYHFRWTKNHEQNRKVIEKIINNNTYM